MWRRKGLLKMNQFGNFKWLPTRVFPKIGGFSPNSSILIGFSIIFTIHFGGPPLFLETPTKCNHVQWFWQGFIVKRPPICWKSPVECICHICRSPTYVTLLGQWLNFKLFGITYLVGKISRSNFFSGSRTAE